MRFNQYFLTLSLTLIATDGLSATLLTDSAFYFGKIAVTSNTSVSTLQMSREGQVTATGNIYILEIGQPGVYTITDLPRFSLVSMAAELPAYSASPIPGTQQFTITAVDMADTVKLDENGSGQFKLGGVLQTSGLGGTYVGPASYQIIIDINISY
jgi:hypothetical protein